eukprot:6275080-Pyramimonas_sp.AAC.1
MFCILSGRHHFVGHSDAGSTREDVVRQSEQGRVVSWSGNGLGTGRDDRRLRGAAQGADVQQHVDLELEVLEQVKQLVDMQAGCAERDNTYMLVLGLGDARSWGIPATSGEHVAWMHLQAAPQLSQTTE